ncbi:MAG: response regulator transcription factor [Planctomycetota bacterium]
MKKNRILVVEDEPRIAHWVTSFFTRAGFEADSVHNGALGLERILHEAPDLVILDRMLPDIDGLEVLRRVRMVSAVPIILLTALGDDHQRIEGLRHGADDYQCKPFHPEELVARAEAILRRVRDESCEQLISENVVLNLDARSCCVRNTSVELTRLQFDILATLMKRPGQVFPRRDLVQAAFDRDFQGSDRAVDVQIRRLRERVESNSSQPQLIETVHGVGYRFSDLVE